jgi:hypothetical protein
VRIFNGVFLTAKVAEEIFEMLMEYTQSHGGLHLCRNSSVSDFIGRPHGGRIFLPIYVIMEKECATPLESVNKPGGLFHFYKALTPQESGPDYRNIF